MDEHPALALREKKDATILVATDLVRRGEADAVVTAGHTGAGHGRRRPAPRAPARRRPPGAGRPDDHRRRARWSCSTSGPTPTRPPRTSPSTPGWARSSPSASWASRTRASPSCRSARRRARAMPASSARPSCWTPPGLRFDGNIEGKDLTRHMADVVVTDAVAGNVVIKFFEGLSGFIFDLWRAEFRRGIRGQSGLPADAARHRPHPRRVRLRARGRVAIARGQGHGHHHPRSGQATDGRLRLRGRRHDGPDPRPGPHRRRARPPTPGTPPRRRPRPPATSPRRSPDERTGADRRSRA